MSKKKLVSKMSKTSLHDINTLLSEIDTMSGEETFKRIANLYGLDGSQIETLLLAITKAKPYASYRVITPEICTKLYQKVHDTINGINPGTIPYDSVVAINLYKWLLELSRPVTPKDLDLPDTM